MENQIVFKKNKNYSFKLNLVELTSIITHSKIRNDPICRLLTDFSEIEAIVKTNKFIRFLFFNKDKVHIILYNEDKIIQISNDFKENDLAGNYYLCALIEDNFDIINYNFTFNYIKTLNDQKKDENNKYYNLIICKEVLLLIKNYMNSEIQDENFEKEISQLQKENIDYITNNINILNEIGLDLNTNSFIEMKIDELYTKIIISLIKNDKLTDFAIFNHIYEQLDLENIDIPFEKNLLENILEALNSKNNYIQKYNIENLNDIHNPKKIMFFYILLKYIFKCPLNVYNIPLLLEAREKIIPFLKTDQFKNISTKTKENEFDEKLTFVLQKLGDLKYEFAIKPTEISTFLYSNLDMEKTNNKYSKENNNNGRILDELDNKNDNIKIEEYNLKKNYFFSPNKDGKIIIEKENPKNRENGIVIKENLGKANGNNEKEKEKEIKENYELKNGLNSYFKNIGSYLAQIQLKSFQDFKFGISFEKQNNQILANYTFIDSRVGKNSFCESDSDILAKKSDELIGFQKIINHISVEYENVNSSKINPNLNKTNDQILNQDMSKLNNIQNMIDEIIPKDQDFKLSKFKRILYKHKESVKFFLQVKEKYFLSCGNDCDIVLYDINMNFITTIPNLEDIIYNITEKDSHKTDYIELIACCLKNIYLITINPNNKFKHIAKKYQIPKYITLFCYNIGSNYIISGNGLTVNILNLFDDELDEEKMIRYSGITHKTGIRIDDNNIAMISNSLLPGGENKISIINIERDEITHEITNNISPNLSENCACIMKFDDGKRFLLVGNKKIKNDERDGMFIANLDLNKKRLKTNFYDTNNFQIYCLCQIILKQQNGAESKFIRTTFFFAGGYDLDKKIGMVKLYQLIDKENMEIKYIQDLDTEEEIYEYEQSINISMNNININDEINNKSMDNNIIVRKEEINESLEYHKKNSKSNNSSKILYNNSRDDINSSDMYDINSSENNNSLSQKFDKKPPDKKLLNEEIKIGLDKDKFYGFKMPVNTITQSEISGEIIITTIDGSVYLFSEPNLSLYMNKDE